VRDWWRLLLFWLFGIVFGRRRRRRLLGEFVLGAAARAGEGGWIEVAVGKSIKEDFKVVISESGIVHWSDR
jgi:hypothetical protein